MRRPGRRRGPPRRLRRARRSSSRAKSRMRSPTVTPAPVRCGPCGADDLGLLGRPLDPLDLRVPRDQGLDDRAGTPRRNRRHQRRVSRGAQQRTHDAAVLVHGQHRRRVERPRPHPVEHGQDAGVTHRIGLEQRVGEPGEGTGVGVRDDLHAVQRDRRWQPDYARPACAPPCRGRHAVLGAEPPDEVARLAVPDATCDLADGEVGVGEQAPGLPHPAFGDPLLHGAARTAADAVVRCTGVSPTASATSRSEIGSW